MKVEMLMPQMGESIAEATISKWRKKVGDSVAKDEVILEISTDKVDSEIPAPAAGVITELLFNEGDVVPVKTKIAMIDTAAAMIRGRKILFRGYGTQKHTIKEHLKDGGELRPPQGAAYFGLPLLRGGVTLGAEGDGVHGSCVVQW
jgi:pyruvate/2-oxoglutarate dehydrogenase complex dihydrolipoamide acyltransferase (E2) component